MNEPEDGKYINPPYPEEVEGFYKIARKRGIELGGAYASNGKAYVKIYGFGRDLYAVIPASSPADPLGEPDMDYNGLRLYSIEKIKQYVEWCRNYIRDVLVELYQINVEQSAIELEKVMPRDGELGYMWLGVAKAELEVVDSSSSCFTPSIYIVEGYAEISEERYPVERLTCYDLTYTALFHEGDRLQVYGKLEEVIDTRSNDKFYSILTGSFEAAEKEYIKLLV